MFLDSIKYLFTVFNKKEIFFLVKTKETYDPVTGDTSIVETKSAISFIKVSMDTDNLPENCLSTDHKYIAIISNIDKTDKLENSIGIKYTIKYTNQLSFSPSTFEVIIRVN
jgi:hypothetical protein